VKLLVAVLLVLLTIAWIGIFAQAGILQNRDRELRDANRALFECRSNLQPGPARSRVFKRAGEPGWMVVTTVAGWTFATGVDSIEVLR
jgi:hypothetical protein